MRRFKCLRPNSNFGNVQKYAKAAICHRITQNAAVKTYQNTAENLVQM